MNPKTLRSVRNMGFIGKVMISAFITANSVFVSRFVLLEMIII